MGAAAEVCRRDLAFDAQHIQSLADRLKRGILDYIPHVTLNGDEAARESIVTAVHRASPLPLPRDPRAFQRRLEIVFKPTE